MASSQKPTPRDRSFVVGEKRSQVAPSKVATQSRQAGVRPRDQIAPAGMGMSARDVASLKASVRPLSGLVPLGVDGHLPVEGLGDIITNIGEMGAAFACSAATFDFLRVNVLNRNDVLPVIRTGMVPFDRTQGVHVIPLMEGDSGGFQQVGGSEDGDFFVPDGQALIVTDFAVSAARSNPGLPESFVSVDPFALAGQVAFFLLADNGQHILAENTISNNQPGSGTEILGGESRDGFPVLTDIAYTSVRAAYNVIRSPFPGFPRIVGARMRGYLVNQVLLHQALSNSVRTGG